MWGSTPYSAEYSISLTDMLRPPRVELSRFWTASMASSLWDHWIYVSVVTEILYLYLLWNFTIARVHEPPASVKLTLATAPKEEKTERSMARLTSFVSPDTSRYVCADDITLHRSQLVRAWYLKLPKQLWDVRRGVEAAVDLCVRRVRRRWRKATWIAYLNITFDQNLVTTSIHKCR